MVREVEARLKEMRTFYGRLRTKKDITALGKEGKELRQLVAKLSDRIKSLAAFTEKLNGHFDSQTKHVAASAK
ncbi:MAG: hypothetical protein P4M11_09335 [Candidatus Pacebacteria bacterium]|nr:hypothetical protein [Candidatus Paceibacterota bacterium]